ERLVVRREDQRVPRQQGVQVFTGIQPLLQRVGVRFGREDTDVRRNARQDLIAGNHELELRAPETRVFGRMTTADDNAKAVIADDQLFAVDETLERLRQA